MFTGDLPWPELVKLEPFAIMYKIAQTKSGPELPEDVSEEGADFLRRCFDVNCKTRATVDELLQHPFVTKDMDCWTNTPQSQMSVISAPEPVPRRLSAPPQIYTAEPLSASHSIQSELLQLTERVDRILQEQSKPHNSRVQSSPSIGAEHMSPVASRPKRKSQPVDSYSSYVSQAYSSHQTYMSQQSFVSQQSQQQQQQQQPSFMPQFQRSRFSPPEDGEMSTEYMYSPQKGM
jgi:serine/threonine protein kinase